MVKTADGEDVADQGIKARAHIFGARRKPRAKKAASKKKTAPKRKSVPVKKKAVEESEEEAECEEISAAEEESDEEDVDVECIDGPSDVAVIVEKFDVGDRIKNPLGLRGTVVECKLKYFFAETLKFPLFWWVVLYYNIYRYYFCIQKNC